MTKAERLKDFMRFVKDTTVNAMNRFEVVASEPVCKKRFSTCLDCDRLDENNKCKECGCNMRFKTRFVATRCPLGKW